MSGLDLRARESLLKGGSRGPALVPGNAATSLVFKAVRGEGLQMPPGKKRLTDAEIQSIGAWIDAGAVWPASSTGAAAEWWSFRKLPRPTVPEGAAANPIDRFIDAKLRDRKLAPTARADRRTLIRRAYFDLHGLPPAPDDVDRFVNDTDPEAWTKLIRKLLDSPRYGERWGRHWLDVVRYADTGGFETDIYFPNAWRYRDWVISAFNTDKPFARFVREQIAGDELYPDDLDLDGGFEIPQSKRENLAAQIATGMYTIGPVYHEAALFGGQIRYEWLTDVVDTTGEAFLGLTLGCARCHNHKFDPLTQRDYHSMMAVFAGSEEKEIPVVSRFATFGFKSGFPNWLRVEDLKGAIQRIDSGARKRVEDRVRSRFSADVLDAYKVKPATRTPNQRQLAAQLEQALTEAGLRENAQGKAADIPFTEEENREKERLIGELGKAALKANPVPQTATVLGHADVVPDIYITHRGDWRSRGDKVGPALPAALAGERAIGEASTADRKLSRRKQLAEWLTEPDHPLTARVMANRVWHWHFGRGIVATPSDFGRQGEEPTHPELLDWLAGEYLAQGGRMKKLHEWIMTSEAYMRSSAFHDGNAKVDANNRYLWRMNRLRLDAEALRDTVLSVAGTLNLKSGGRPVIPPLTKEEYSALWSRAQWPETLDPGEHTRRSVYLYVKRTFPLPMLSAFDAPDTSASCARRDSTTVAPQALTLMNGEFMVRQAAKFAERARAASDPADSLWRLAYGRAPTANERSRFAQMAAAGDAGLHQLALVVLNTNEFLYVD